MSFKDGEQPRLGVVNAFLELIETFVDSGLHRFQRLLEFGVHFPSVQLVYKIDDVSDTSATWCA